MGAVEENLRAESRVQSEEQLIAFKQILNPLQASWALLKSMPEHCDVMALFNAIDAIYS